MGKRRKEGPHADKYNCFDDDDDDNEEIEQENNIEKEPLKPEEIASIKSRKKLIATRRVATQNGDLAKTAALTPFSAFNSVPIATTDSTDNKSSVFSGFKGFSAFKSSAPVPVTTPITATNNGTEVSKPAETKQPSFFSSAFNANFSDSSSSTTMFNKFETKTVAPSTMQFMPTVTLKSSETAAVETKTVEPIMNNSNHSNICEKELNFMNDLNDLYERYYGGNKRSYSIPADLFELDSEDDSQTDEKDESKKKYACLLAELNKHCSTWISKHVEENPLVILTPVFVDYFAYLILFEKNFFPSTFKKETVTKSVNGTGTGSIVKLNAATTSINGTTETTVPVAAPSLFSSNNKNGSDNKPFNGFKFGSNQPKEDETHVNGVSSKESSKEQEKTEVENDKIIEQSSKTFASLIKTQTTSFNPISLSGSSSFLFKPTPTDTTDSSKKNTDSIQTEIKPSSFANLSNESGSLFKFGSTSSVTAPVSTEKKGTDLTEESKTILPKTNLFSASVTSDVTPTFKFGDISKPVASAKATTTTQPALSLFSKSTESITENSSSSTSFFSNLNKTVTPTTTATTSAFPSSLFSSNISTSSPIFKPFSSAETTQPIAPAAPTLSMFSSLNAPTPSTTSGTTPIFSFQSSLTSKPSILTGSIFGTTPFGKSDSASSSLFADATPVASREGGENEEEEYEPPKPEVSEMKENGSVFDKRIKLYYFNEKEKKFCDRGIGNLYLKPIPNSESTQLIIRADNSLANILLNVKLSKVFPISKISAKDVSYICLPNPPIPSTDSKVPCKFLFKVKSEDDAKELLEKLNELKR